MKKSGHPLLVKISLSASAILFLLISDYGNPLGVESGDILDSQFSSSSASLSSFEPFKARLNSKAAWCMAQNSLSEYLQIDLLTPHLIQQVCPDKQVSFLGGDSNMIALMHQSINLRKV